MKTALRTLRLCLDATFVLLVVAILALVFAVNLGPWFGHQVVVIRGGSMSPAISLGSAVDIARVQPADLSSGDVVMLKEPTGTIVTHRVTRVVTLSDGMYVETKGDANQSADPSLHSVSEIAGRVDFTAPGLGYVIYLLTMPTGLASVLSLAMTLLFAIWLLEDLEQDFATGKAETPRTVPSAGAAG